MVKNLTLPGTGTSLLSSNLDLVKSSKVLLFLLKTYVYWLLCTVLGDLVGYSSPCYSQTDVLLKSASDVDTK